MRFEPTRAEHIGLAVQRLTSSCRNNWSIDKHLSVLKGHCHGHFLALLVKWHQNYDLVLSTMQEMLLELKGKDILANCLKKRMTVNSFHHFFQTTRTELEKV